MLQRFNINFDYVNQWTGHKGLHFNRNIFSQEFWLLSDFCNVNWISVLMTRFVWTNYIHKGSYNFCKFFILLILAFLYKYFEWRSFIKYILRFYEGFFNPLAVLSPLFQTRKRNTVVLHKDLKKALRLYNIFSFEIFRQFRTDEFSSTATIKLTL